MNLRRLLSARRLRACRAVFNQPLRVLWRLAFVKRSTPSLRLSFRDGAELEFIQPNKFNWFWDRVLADPKARATLKASSGRLAGTLGNTSFDVSTAPDAMQFVRWVQMDAPQIESVVQEDSLLRVGFDGRAALVRLGSITDRTGLREVWLRDSYGLGRVAGRLGTVVDLGGNIGMFTLRAAGLASRVITVEPVPDNVAMIRRNLELAGDAGHVQIVPHACGGEDEGELTLWVAPNAHGVNSVHRPHTERYAAAEALKCRSVSLRRLFDEHAVERCDLLKCDVEGSEYAIFEAAPDDVLARIRRIVLEYHLFRDAAWKPKLEALAGKLRAAGFHVQHSPTERANGDTVEAGYLSATRQG